MISMLLDWKNNVVKDKYLCHSSSHYNSMTWKSPLPSVCTVQWLSAYALCYTNITALYLSPQKKALGLFSSSPLPLPGMLWKLLSTVVVLDSSLQSISYKQDHIVCGFLWLLLHWTLCFQGFFNCIVFVRPSSLW